MIDASSLRSRPHFASALLLAALLLLLAATAAPVLAQDEAGAVPPELLMVDATGEPFVVIRTAAPPDRVAVTIDGVAVDTDSPVSVHDSSLQVQTAIVIDNSAESSDLIEEFKAVAADYVANAPADEQIEVWTTGGEGRLRVGSGSPRDRTLRVIDGVVTASGPNHLWDAVRGSVLSFVDAVPGATNVVVLTANVDNGSINSAAQARGAVLSAHAGVFLVHAGETMSDAESRLVNVSVGGAYALEQDPSTLASYGGSLTEAIASTWAVPFRGDAVVGAFSIEVQVDDQTLRASYSSGAVTSGRALAPVPTPEPTTLPGLGFLDGATGKRLGLVLGAVAAGLGAYSIAMLFNKETSTLDDILEVYSGTPPSASGAEPGEKRSLAKSLFVRRAVEITEGLAKRQGTLERAEAMLERADLPLRAGEALTAYAGIVFALLAVGLLLGGGLVGALVMGVLGVLAPPAVINFLANRRKKAFVSQLPDTLQLLSSTLKAGYSFMQGVEAVSHEIEDPMGGELRRIVTEAQLGRPLEDAMDASAVRMDSAAFAWAIASAVCG